MKNPAKISEAEWQVMEVLWRHSPQGAAELIVALEGKTAWKSNTVRTLLARLVRKGTLKTKQEGNRFLYHPVFSRDQYVAKESASFLERVFCGSTKPLLLHFVETSRLSKAQIEELKNILDKEAK